MKKDDAGGEVSSTSSPSSTTDESPAAAPAATATATATATGTGTGKGAFAKFWANKKARAIVLAVMAISAVGLLVGLLAGLLTKHAHGQTPATGSPNNTAQPNIIMIMTDDQDRRLGSTDYQTNLQRLLMDQGTEFTNHYTTQALCCPARSSFLRGQQVRMFHVPEGRREGVTVTWMGIWRGRR